MTGQLTLKIESVINTPMMSEPEKMFLFIEFFCQKKQNSARMKMTCVNLQFR